MDEHASDDVGPEGMSNAREMQAALARALDSLSHEHRNVVVLTYFHDLPYAEIAQIMDCPVDTVKTRMFHARRKLRVLLQDELGDMP
jgi:RNA polymerase sigma-70 factor (ECF subfamily)